MKEINFDQIKQDILDATNGGLQIIQSYYPATRTGRHFKIRDERTASASLKEMKGVWYVHDWGSWDRPKNAFDVCMYEEGIDFGEALKRLAARYQIPWGGRVLKLQPEYKKRKVKAGEKPGDYHFFFKDQFSDKELKVIGKAFTNEVADKYHFKSIEYYEFVKKDGEVLQIHSTDDYPIFAFDFGTWQKIYQPLAKDKKDRFRYAGDKPKDFVFGLDVVEERFQIITQQYEEEQAFDQETSDKKKDKNNEPPKLDRILIASGDRDALNMASFGYNVIWLNSETADLDKQLYKKLSKMAEEIINVPDIDNTGLIQARKLAFKYIDIKTAFLPEELRQRKDRRGNPMKDFTDFVSKFYHPDKYGKRFNWFDKILTNALPVKFWSEYISPKTKTLRYRLHLPQLLHFLAMSGFARYRLPQTDDFIYIHITGHIVKKINEKDIADYVIKWAQNKMLPVQLLDLIMTAPHLKENYLMRLPYRTLDFINHGKNYQYWYFPKFVLRITADKLITIKPDDSQNFVWEDKILDHNVTQRNFVEKPHFRIFKDANGDWDIEILKKDNKFFNFLINASRIHWRKELEERLQTKSGKEQIEYKQKYQFDIDGPLLTDEEVLEQKQHLINKIFAIGYLLHRYKTKKKAWFVFAMDNKISDVEESHGGSGKSLTFENLQYILKNRFYIPGRNKNATKNEFIYDGVSEETDYIFVDDMSQYFDFQYFFSDITSSMKINQKNKSQFELPFDKAPKMCGTSNYPPQNLDPSTARRILFTVFSDYYHFNKDGEYLETRQVSDDFGGKELFTEFDIAEWNAFYNFMAQALQFFMRTPDKIDPPMANVRKRNLIAEMGTAFKDWAEVYFSEQSGRLNTLVPRPVAYEDFRRETRSKMGTNKFKKAVEAYCKYKGYDLNPKEMRDKSGRIIKKRNIDGKVKSVEMFFLKTPETNIDELMAQVAEEEKQLDDERTVFDGIPEDEAPY